MVGYFPHCTFNLNPRATSIDTPPHCFTPAPPHRSHARRRADRVRRGEERRGADQRRSSATRSAGSRGCVRASSWACAARRCVEANPAMKGLDLRQPRARQLGRRPRRSATSARSASSSGRGLARRQRQGRAVRPAGGGAAARGRAAGASSPSSRRWSRGMLSATTPKVMHYADGPAILEFVGSARGAELAAKGTTCPDHFLRTKILPLWVPFTPGAGDAGGARRAAAARWSSATRPTTPPTTSAASGPTRRRCATRCRCCCSIPGIGLLAFQKDKQTARVAAEYFVNTINVDALGRGRRRVRADPRAGGLRHRVLAARGGQAAAPAEAEGARRPDRARHRRRRRHRPGGGAAAARRGRARRADATAIRPRSTRRAPRCGKAFGADKVRGVVCDVTRRGVGARRRWPTPRRVRRPRHPRLERRHRLGVADRGDDARDVADEHGHPRDRLLPGRARRLRADEAAGPRRLDRLRRQQERAGRLAGRRRLLLGQGGGAAPGALPGGRGRAASASAPTSSTPTR